MRLPVSDGRIRRKRMRISPLTLLALLVVTVVASVGLMGWIAGETTRAAMATVDRLQDELGVLVEERDALVEDLHRTVRLLLTESRERVELRDELEIELSRPVEVSCLSAFVLVPVLGNAPDDSFGAPQGLPQGIPSIAQLQGIFCGKDMSIEVFDLTRLPEANESLPTWDVP